MDMNLEGKSVLVVGLGRTGEALCSFLADRGTSVSVSENLSGPVRQALEAVNHLQSGY